MEATFNSNPRTTAVSCYSPTNARDEIAITIFYDAISSLAQHIPKHHVRIIIRDMNTELGKDENYKFAKQSMVRKGSRYS